MGDGRNLSARGGGKAIRVKKKREDGTIARPVGANCYDIPQDSSRPGEPHPSIPTTFVCFDSIPYPPTHPPYLGPMADIQHSASNSNVIACSIQIVHIMYEVCQLSMVPVASRRGTSPNRPYHPPIHPR
jgi:hypothetical protein